MSVIERTKTEPKFILFCRSHICILFNLTYRFSGIMQIKRPDVFKTPGRRYLIDSILFEYSPPFNFLEFPAERNFIIISIESCNLHFAEITIASGFLNT